MKKSLLFATLMILAGCGVKAAAEEPPKAVSVTVIESSESWDGTLLPQYPEGAPKVTLLRITIPPRAKLNVHKHPVINVGYMTKGQLNVVSEQGDTLRLKAGDGIVELVNKYHFGENPSDEPSEIIVFYAGNEDSPLSIYK